MGENSQSRNAQTEFNDYLTFSQKSMKRRRGKKVGSALSQLSKLDDLQLRRVLSPGSVGKRLFTVLIRLAISA
jgi:hypothetical protein